MVNELAPYNEQHRYRVVMEALILQQHSHEVQKGEKSFQPCARERRQHVEWEEVDR